MNQAPAQNEAGKLRILVAPLDWGLGHATRCIPVVKELLKQGAVVWLAGNKIQQQLLSTEFPQLPFISLPGYDVRYGSSKRSFILKMLRQLPKLRRRISQEHRWLQQQVEQYKFDAVISDNRFGLWHRDIPCVFITHQLTIVNPLGNWGHRFLQKINYRHIRRFQFCWVPDMPGSENLAGKLSHPAILPPIPLQYIAPLTRLKPVVADQLPVHLFISLSGPEPQRTLLEEKILQQIEGYSGTIVMVRGLPLAANILPSTDRFTFYNHLPASAYAAEMQKANYVICRSGYSTVMDIAMLQKQAIFIPTPGQSEQEYLGAYLMEKRYAYSIAQDKFQLPGAISSANEFSYRPFPVWNNEPLAIAVAQLLKAISR